MQSYLWMRPALQVSEAVLLPALPRHMVAEPRFSDRFTHVKASENPFRPVPEEGETRTTMALSTYVRPRGSMAGRGILRAVGVRENPYSRSTRPTFGNLRGSMAFTRRFRVR